MWLVVAVPSNVVVETDAAGATLPVRLSDVESKLFDAQAAGWVLRFVVCATGWLIHYLEK